MATVNDIFNFLVADQKGIVLNSNNLDTEIKEVIKFSLENLSPNSLFWLNDRNESQIENIQSGIIIAGLGVSNFKFKTNINLIMVPNPRRAFSRVLANFFVKNPIHRHEVPLPSCTKIGKNVHIGLGTIIHSNVTIGDNSFIGNNNVIHDNTIIGSNVKIGSNNTIGGVGFGYEKNQLGIYEVVPHIGNVQIKDFVEIGNNNCIDRAVLGSTLLNEHAKVDNLCHIAHGATIGRNSLIIANSMIAGSAEIGDNVWIAPSTSVINQGKIGSNSMTGMGSVVITQVGENELVAGVPARKLRSI